MDWGAPGPLASDAPIAGTDGEVADLVAFLNARFYHF